MGKSISLHSLYLRTPITKESTEVGPGGCCANKGKGPSRVYQGTFTETEAVAGMRVPVVLSTFQASIMHRYPAGLEVKTPGKGAYPLAFRHLNCMMREAPALPLV